MSTEPDPRVVVKFDDSIDDDGRLADASRRFSEHFRVRLDQEFPSLTRSAFEELREFAPSQLMNYHSVAAPRGEEEALAKRLSSAPHVEMTYVQWPASLPWGSEAYRDAGPVGVGAATVAGLPNTQGQGVSCAVVDDGWPEPRDAPPPPGRQVVHSDLGHLALATDGVNEDETGHGLAVLGIIGAQASGPGGFTGIAPALLGLSVVSRWRKTTDRGYKVGDAIAFAAGGLKAGDVICVQAQGTFSAQQVPIEVYAAERSAMQTATNKGVVVIEPAGNGPPPPRPGDPETPPLNLDTVLVTEYIQGVPTTTSLDPGHPAFQDSGAVVVGSVQEAGGVLQAKGSCTGKRVDCCSWGAGVRTCAPPDTYFLFGGTSAASAIIAGVAVATQGLHLSNGPGGGPAPPAPPAALRAMLGNTAYGTAFPGVGVMPDLCEIRQAIRGAGPAPCGSP